MQSFVTLPIVIRPTGAERAHPKVWNVRLQVLDAGRLTDGQGNEVDFCNVIIIMTSNTGAKNIAQKIRESRKIRESSLDVAVSKSQVN
jgi:ATP-dependent Clp protease ATP-binding subunit ClpA